MDTYTKTLIAVVLDESGSMQSKQTDVIGGFNTFLAEQRKGTDTCRLSITKFNTKVWQMQPPAPLVGVPDLSPATYTPGGLSALLDAVASAVREAEVVKAADERVLVLIITDGEENSSRETTREQLKAIVAAHEAQGDWTFTYLGPSPERWADTGVTTTAANNAAYNSRAPRESFTTMSMATASFRAGGTGHATAFYGASPKTTPAALEDVKDQDPTWSAPHK